MNKSVFLILLLTALLNSVTFSQKSRELARQKPDTLKTDSLEYELVILDPGFDSWLASKPPKDFYSNSYYASFNRQYVSEWNQRYFSGRKNGLYETYIDYNPNTDYDIDLNYRLYYYFRYFEETNHVKLISGRR